MVAGKVFMRAAFENMSVALAIAVLVILIMTMNWKITLICMATLASIVSLIFLLTVMIGWKIDIIASIAISIATGLAVDYVLHLSHSFNNQIGDAKVKTRLALKEMGVSITSGAMTTFFACCALYLCSFLWFKIFGYFITILIFSSFFTSMVAMMAAMSLFGPGDPPDGTVILPAICRSWNKDLTIAEDNEEQKESKSNTTVKKPEDIYPEVELQVMASSAAELPESEAKLEREL